MARHKTPLTGSSPVNRSDRGDEQQHRNAALTQDVGCFQVLYSLLLERIAPGLAFANSPIN